MSQLLEHILDGDFISANELFESKMAELQEQKLCEAKKELQAEVFGGLTHAQIQARKELGWKKAADVLEDPRSRKVKGITKFSAVKKKSAKKKTVKEDVSRSEVEAEKQKLTAAGKAHPSYKEVPRQMNRPVSSKEKEKTATQTAPGYKALLPKGTIRPSKLSMGDRYQRALSQARDLELRGSEGKVAAVQKAYRPYRAASAVTGYLKGAAGRLASAAQETWEE